LIDNLPTLQFESGQSSAVIDNFVGSLASQVGSAPSGYRNNNFQSLIVDANRNVV
jgi:hypothetical protein